VDVTGMTAPFLFRAVGTVAGRQVSYASSATAADIGNTINVTPFTDLIVANIAGVAANEFFDNPKFDKLTPAEIDDARAKLTASLLPILKSAGVADGFDLLRSSFAANRTGFDAAMDAIRVEVDPISKKAIIKDLVNNTQIEDALDSKAATDVLPVPAISIKGAVDDVVVISTTFQSLTGLFAKGLPSANDPALLNIFSADMLDSGLGRSDFLSENLLDPELIGAKFIRVDLLQRVSPTLIWGNVYLKTAEGVDEDGKVLFAKEGDVWRFYGNRLHTDIDVSAVNSRQIRIGQADLYERRIEVWVDGSADNRIGYFTVAGPGISGVIGFIRSSTNGASNFNVDGYTYNTSQIGECGVVTGPCINIEKITNDAQYTVTYYDQKNGNVVLSPDTLTLPRPPVSNADALANVKKWFVTPEFAQFVPAGYQSITSATLATKIVWINPTDPLYAPEHIGINVQYSNADTGATSSEDLNPAATSFTFGQLVTSEKTIASPPYFWIFSKGPFDRMFITQAQYPAN
jgi:hypothetical protein